MLTNQLNIFKLTPKWVGEYKAAGIPIVILSNAIGLRVLFLAKKLGVDYIAMARKPSPKAVYKAAKRLGVDVAQLGMVGDQIFADVEAANRAGAIPLLVDPKAPRWFLKSTLRRLERRKKSCSKNLIKRSDIMSINGKLKKLLGDNTGIIISSPENRRYFTRFPSSDGFLLVTSDDAVFFTDSRYVEAAKKTVSACPIEELTNAVKQLPAYFRERGVKRVLFECDRLFISDFNKLKGYFEGFECVIDGSLDECITALRVVKTKREIDLIKKAQKIAEAAFLHIVGVYKSRSYLEIEIA